MKVSNIVPQSYFPVFAQIQAPHASAPKLILKCFSCNACIGCAGSEYRKACQPKAGLNLQNCQLCRMSDAPKRMHPPPSKSGGGLSREVDMQGVDTRLKPFHL